jgi:GDP-mannose 4,6 dehydratase
MAESSSKVALIARVTGQDGAYLAEFLLSIRGPWRETPFISFNTERIDHRIHDPHEEGVSFYMHYGDVTDATNIIRIVQETQPDEIYNLAAQWHVQLSFETPEYIASADGLGTLRLLEAFRILGRENKTRFLSGLDLRAVRQGARDPPKGNDAVLSTLPVRRREALHALDHGQLPRGLGHAWLGRHPFQPRESNSRRNLRHPQDYACGRVDRTP